MLKLILVITSFALCLPAAAAPGPEGPPSTSTAKPARSNTGVMRYDANGDGWVDREEWKAGQESRFRELDIDRDGRLTQDELFGRTPAAPGNVLPTDRQAQRQTSYFRLIDTDKDGFVSKAEFMAQAERNFARCDLDKDGRINTAECRQALRRPSSQPARAER